MTHLSPPSLLHFQFPNAKVRIEKATMDHTLADIDVEADVVVVRAFDHKWRDGRPLCR